MPRPRPNLPKLTIPQVEQWLDRFDSDSIDELPEFSLNLGAESPASTTSFEDRIPSPSPRQLVRRRPSNLKTQNLRKRDSVDRDCGICFEYAVQPSRTLCCGKIFCTEHITDWLHGPSSDGRCPSCSAPCSTTHILSLASPILSPPKTRPRSSSTPLTPTHSSSTTTDPITISRVRSQSTSTSTSKQSRSSDESDNNTLCSTPEEGACYNGDEEEDDKGRLHWLLLGFHSSLSTFSSSSTTQQPSTTVYPFIDPGSSTLEVLGRLTSVMGLTLLFYALLAS